MLSYDIKMYIKHRTKYSFILVIAIHCMCYSSLAFTNTGATGSTPIFNYTGKIGEFPKKTIEVPDVFLDALKEEPKLPAISSNNDSLLYLHMEGGGSNSEQQIPITNTDRSATILKTVLQDEVNGTENVTQPLNPRGNESVVKNNEAVDSPILQKLPKGHSRRKGAPIEEPITEISSSSSMISTVPVANHFSTTTIKAVASVQVPIYGKKLDGIDQNNKSANIKALNTFPPKSTTTTTSNQSTSNLPNERGSSIATNSSLVKMVKPKPLKTSDINSFPDPPAFPERTPSRHDYVIPIVVAFLTIPLLIVLILYLYKKGSEFWERRHYRRMDFLIDGMYND